jgi:hypothetical protein
VTIILVSKLLLTGRDLGNSLATTGPGYRYHPRNDSEQIAIAKELSSGFGLTWSHPYGNPLGPYYSVSTLRLPYLLFNSRSSILTAEYGVATVDSMFHS